MVIKNIDELRTHTDLWIKSDNFNEICYLDLYSFISVIDEIKGCKWELDTYNCYLTITVQSIFGTDIVLNFDGFFINICPSKHLKIHLPKIKNLKFNLPNLNYAIIKDKVILSSHKITDGLDAGFDYAEQRGLVFVTPDFYDNFLSLQLNKIYLDKEDFEKIILK